jgi:hydroxypyruvate isomerase
VIDRRSFVVAGAVAATACATSAVSPPSTANTQNSTSRSLREKLAGFALNTESWFLDMPFKERFDAAARAGFSHVEFWALNDDDRKAETLAKITSDAGVSIAQIVGDAPALARPETREEFLDNCKRAVERADVLSTDIITFVGHQNVEGISKSDSLKTYADHMAAAAPIFEATKIFAAIEPFNPYDHPGHFIYGSQDATALIRQINSPYVKLNWDLFHMQRAEGELIGNLRQFSDTICYVQIADAPDRGQPGTGDVNYASVIRQVRAGGYDRPIGLEFWAKDRDYDRAVADMLLLADSI